MPHNLIIRVDQPGLQSTIQDLGRPGYQAMGIPLGGALDRRSAIQANYLVGNVLSEPLIEITLLGPKLIFEKEAQIALTGANLSAKLDDDILPMYQTVVVQPGAILRFGKPQKGCRAYLAVGGQWQIKTWLESASLATQQAELLTPDSLIKKGQQLRVKIQQFIKPRMLRPEPLPESGVCLDLLPGPEFELFSRRDVAHFFAQSYQITPSSNRMGYRLSPSIPDFSWPKENISSGIVPGTIQITNEGQAISLLADAQTVGGYPRIANLTNGSINKIAQLRPGDHLRFKLKGKTD